MTPDEYCQQRTAKSGTSFYYSFLFLPPERRRAITVDGHVKIADRPPLPGLVEGAQHGLRERVADRGCVGLARLRHRRYQLECREHRSRAVHRLICRGLLREARVAVRMAHIDESHREITIDSEDDLCF